MKKTLSVVLTSAMALSMFSSLAFAAKSSADFTDLKDLDAATKVKFDAMISAGIFDGVSETTFGLKDEMNRAQFAKVAALIMGLEVNKDLKTSSFTDVSVTDEANGYALPYIEALKTAGVTDGYAEGQYNPAGKVTKEQLATFLVRVLGQDEAAKDKTGTDKTVSGWAQGYVALALELKLLANGEDGTFGGMSNATRDLLVTGAYEAKQQYVPAGKVSVTGAKATGVQQVTVNFNKPVDTEKAKLALTKGTVDVVTTTKFADDKKSAVLTLTDVKLGTAEYTVTMSGLDAESVGTASAKFTAEEEAVKSLEFVTASDTVAQSENAQIKLAAKNQYGENVSMSASNFTAVTSGFDSSLTKDDEGNLVLKIDTATMSGTTTPTTPSVTMIPVYVYHNDTRVSTQKTFKLGTAPFVSKIELGAAKYSNTDKNAVSTTGETATYALNQYDQYGNPVAYEDTDGTNSNVTVIVAPYAAEIDNEYGDFDGNGFGEVKLSLNGNVDKTGQYDVTVYAGSASATAKLSIGSTKLATKIEFGDLAEEYAAGDDDVYVDLIAYDANGVQLSADDIASTENVERIKLSGTNVGGTPTIVTSGQHKGQVKLPKLGAADSIAYLNAYIATANVNSTATKQIKIGKTRFADSLKVTEENKTKAVLGGETDFTIEVRDQYGATLDSVGSVEENGKALTYSVKLELSDDKENKAGISVVYDDGTALLTAGKNVTLTQEQFEKFNDGLTFKTTSGTIGKATLKATLLKTVAGSDAKEIQSVTREITSVDPASTTLTYGLDKPASLYAAIDSSVIDESAEDVTKSSLAGEVSVTAKDNAGNEVAIPEDRITSITSSNYSAAVAQATNAGGGNGMILGNKAGKSTISVVYKTAKNEYKQASFEVEVKEELPTVSTMTADETYEGASQANAYEYMDLKVVDQYGVEYTKAEINQYDNLLQVRYTLENADGATKATINDKTGAITMNNSTSFKLTAIAPNGKTTTTYVTKK